MAPSNRDNFFATYHEFHIPFHWLHVIIGVLVFVVSNGQPLFFQAFHEAIKTRLRHFQSLGQGFGAARGPGTDEVVNALQKKEVGKEVHGGEAERWVKIDKG